jgi:hypothetical protein
MPFVGTPKWIRYQTIPKQIQVNAAGHLGGIPRAVMEQLPRTNQRLKLARHKGLGRGTSEAAGLVISKTRANNQSSLWNDFDVLAGIGSFIVGHDGASWFFVPVRHPPCDFFRVRGCRAEQNCVAKYQLSIHSSSVSFSLKASIFLIQFRKRSIANRTSGRYPIQTKPCHLPAWRHPFQMQHLNEYLPILLTATVTVQPSSIRFTRSSCGKRRERRLKFHVKQP